MIISIVNQSTVKSDDDVQSAVRAVNRQIAEDVTPYWGLSAILRLEATGKGGTARNVRGDALIRIRDDIGASHFVLDDGMPEGVIFTKLPELVKESHPFMTWTAALSHEAIELLVDPNVNTLIRGPHPKASRDVFYVREVCDPVQSQVYDVDGWPVSNFVTPAYYVKGKKSSDTNFLGTPLRPFGWVEHGQVGYYDPTVRAHDGYQVWPPFTKHDVRKKIALVKDRMNAARILRYGRPLRRRKR